MSNKEAALQKITALVERFEEQIDSYRKSSYNETQTRRDFIDPFFKALGWDIDNEQGNAEAYREVIHEDRVKVGDKLKAPDYSFKLAGGKRLFFVEAKKPSIVVKDEIPPAYQIRRYGWSAKLPISIITDFEEFAIYDCTKKPLATDKASTARIKYITFTDYVKEFDFIWDTFSKEKVLKGSFDKFVVSDTHKKGTATVDKEFLNSLDTWRTYLATSICINNKQLDEDEINYVVQQIIDRIIFLRIAEDRQIEPYGNLKQSLQQGDYYKNLFHLFQLADEKYNSGLFDFKKDQYSKDLKVDNKVIKNIIKELYYPDSPYEFSVLAVEILGSAYEQFLGKQIKVDTGHRIKIEEKPEVRKAGGVYYTPQYIVEYIVKITVGKLIEGKTPQQIEKIKIVDPACGSGSFLLGAYQFLLDYHKDYYNQQQVKKKGKENPITPDGRLTTNEKKKILLNNIFGVDIDVNAVEVTKLSLLLKCMEGETAASIATQATLFHERVLPTLDNNIKDGNSLVDVDFYENQLDFGEDKKIKPFSWKRAFPEVFKQGGFDCVIGNPPYGALFVDSEISYFKSKYNVSVFRGESYVLFLEMGLNLLLKNGILGLIIPDTILNLGFTEPIRKYILRLSEINEIVSLPSNVFVGATVDTILIFTTKSLVSKPFHETDILVQYFNKKVPINRIVNPTRTFKVSSKEWYDLLTFNLQSDSIEQNLIHKLKADAISLSRIAEMFSGVKVYEVGKGQPPQTEEIRDSKPFTSSISKGKDWKPFYDGKHIGRYQNLWSNNNWIKYGTWLAAPRIQDNFEGEKILIRKITGKTLIANYVEGTTYCNTLLFVMKITNIEYSYKTLLAILNSILIGWYFRKKFQVSSEDTFPQIMIRDILQFPIPKKINQESNKKLTKLVDLLIELNLDRNQTALEYKVNQIENKIEHCETQINELVYQLYGLTNEEIAIVESNFIN